MYRRFIFLWMLALLLGGTGFSSCSDFQTKTYRVGVSLGSRCQHHQVMVEEMEREADNENCFDLEIRFSDDSVEQQMADIQALAASDMDLLIVCPSDPASMAPAIEKIFDQGIPVLVVDRGLPRDGYTAFIGADHYDMGRTLGEYIVRKIENKGRVLVITRDGRQQSSMANNAGLFNVLRTQSDIEVVTLDASTREKVAQQVPDVISRHKSIDFVLAESHELGMGAIDAVAKLGLDNVPTIVCDEEGFRSNAIRALNAGALIGVVESVTSGERVIRLAHDILEGNQFQRYNYSAVNVIDNSNENLMSMLREELEEERHKRDLVNQRYDQMQESLDERRYIDITVAVLVFALLVSIWMMAHHLIERKKNLVSLSFDKEHVEKERKQLKTVNREQLVTLEQGRRFLSSVSHDLRAPLTLIIDPVRQLEQSKTLSPEDRRLVNLIVPNVRMQYRLVRQLSDLMRNQDGRLYLDLKEFDFEESVRHWLEQFKNQSVPKHLNFTYIIEPNDYTMVADEEKMIRLVYDLLGYAYKFTPVNGLVTFRSTVEGEGYNRRLHVIVTDTGIGIPKHARRHFFDAYVTGHDAAGSSSLGLLLAKLTVEMHKGEITATDNPLGKGTQIELFVPMTQPLQNGKSLSKDQKYILDEEDQLTNLMLHELTDVTSIETPTLQHDTIVDVDSPMAAVEEKSDDTKLEILVVDDNHSMREYFRMLLAKEYRVVEAANGQEGLQQAIHRMPNLVIADGMMPIMDGWEFCAKLKADQHTAHIPVLMVSAYFDQDRLVKAYEAGVDAYIPKPFKGDALIAAIKSLIENRNRVRERFGNGTLPDGKPIQDLSSGERTWVDRLYKYIQENISNPEINVEDMGKEFGLGRVQFYRRCKQLTGLAPNELIRSIRLKRSFTLLSTSDMSISEVAYAVGFSSPSYFSRCYRDYFGQTPKERMMETK